MGIRSVSIWCTVFLALTGCTSQLGTSGLSGTDSTSTSSDGNNDSGSTGNPPGTTGTISVTFSTSAVSSAHRYATTMYGGWGPHLGHLLRSPANDLWFADDSGNDVNVNAGLRYFKNSGGTWQQMGTNAFAGTVQQNTGSLMSGNFILSYGVDIADSRVEECYFDTTNPSYHACNLLPFDTGASSNYIGATISPSGTRVVWWTSTNGVFNYIYNFGGGWNGPVTSGEAGYADFSYVYARLDPDNSHIYFFGSAAHGQGGASVGYDALFASTTLGIAVTNWRNLESNNIALESWLDPHGGVHIFARADSAPLYFYMPKAGTLATESIPDSAVFDLRIIETSDSANLVLAFNDGTVKYRSVALNSINGAINWQNSPLNTIPVPPGAGIITLYPESAMYQMVRPAGFGFAVNGTITQGTVSFIQRN